MTLTTHEYIHTHTFGHVIAVRDRSKKHASVVAGTESRQLFETDWLDVSEGKLESTVKALPDENRGGDVVMDMC